MAGAEHANLEVCIKGLPSGVDGGHILMVHSSHCCA